MKQGYRTLSIALILFGLWNIFQDIVHPPQTFFRGIDVLVGFALILLGAHNLLNIEYGANARGVTYCAIGGNLGLVIISVAYGRLPGSWDEWVGYLLSVLLLLVSLAYQRGRYRLHVASQ